MSEVTVYLGLGSNVGDRHATIESALARLDAADGLSVVEVSPLIETLAVGPPQPAYLNGAAEVTTTLQPAALLALLHAVEAGFGRDRARERRWGPRPLDLDLLLYGDRVIDEPGLTVPHPRMLERRFVLEPLAAIAPHAVHPSRGVTIQCLLSEYPTPCDSSSQK